MRALVFNQNLSLDRNYPDPRPESGERLVRVSRAGICNTDIEVTRGYKSFRGVLGHEFVGTLEDGTRVVGEINASDGTCAACRRGDNNHCENRRVLGLMGLDGSFADYLVLPEANLHRVPNLVSDVQAAFAEPLAAALEIIEQVHVKPTDRVLVIGDGKLGLLVAQVLQHAACDLTVLGRHDKKLDILRRRGIATTSKISDGVGRFDIAVECSGAPDGFELALDHLRPRGTLVLKSTFHGSTETSLSRIAVDEITVVGSRCGPFPPALRMLEKGMIDVESLVEAEYPLEMGIDAFQRAMSPGALKIQIIM